MQFLARVGMLSVVCFCLLCGVAFGHSDFKPRNKTDPCVDYEKTTVMEYFWPRYTEYSQIGANFYSTDTVWAHGWGRGSSISGPAIAAARDAEDGHTCFGHWMEYRRQQQSQQSEEDPPEENEPTPPNTDSDSTPTEEGGGSRHPQEHRLTHKLPQAAPLMLNLNLSLSNRQNPQRCTAKNSRSQNVLNGISIPIPMPGCPLSLTALRR